MNVKEVSVFLKNVPGQLARVADTLASQKINIRGLIVEEADLFSIIRLTCDDCEKAVKVLKGEFDVGTDEVLEVKVKNRPGSLAALARILGEKGINIEYCYVALSPQGRSTGLIIRVDKVAEARAALVSHKIPVK